MNTINQYSLILLIGSDFLTDSVCVVWTDWVCVCLEFISQLMKVHFT